MILLIVPQKAHFAYAVHIYILTTKSENLDNVLFFYGLNTPDYFWDANHLKQRITDGCAGVNGKTTLIHHDHCNFKQCTELYKANEEQHIKHIMECHWTHHVFNINKPFIICIISIYMYVCVFPVFICCFQSLFAVSSLYGHSVYMYLPLQPWFLIFDAVPSIQQRFIG